MSTFLSLLGDFINFIFGVALLAFSVWFMYGIYLIQKDRDIARKKAKDEYKNQ